MPQDLLHMIVVLPGITGSVLKKHGHDLWTVPNILGNAVQNWIPGLKPGIAEQMLLHHDDAFQDDLGDGIEPAGLMSGVYIQPGLFTLVDGYKPLTDRIKSDFVIREGTLDLKDTRPANYFEFAYDWRRDNRYNARRLQNLIKHKLPLWQAERRTDKAKVILVAHSMGGLVARYYLECLGGREDCRALITMGTPYRGSIKSLNYLENGYRQSGFDFSTAARSFTSMYQLLPIYESVYTEQGYKRVAEIEGWNYLDAAMTADALRFHREIEESVTVNGLPDETQYSLIPLVGTLQPTLQSARLFAKNLTAVYDLPEKEQSQWNWGDDSVPFISAIPLEYSDMQRERGYAEHHGALPGNSEILNELSSRIGLLQTGGQSAMRRAGDPFGISFHVEDLYMEGESIALAASILAPPGNLLSVKPEVNDLYGYLEIINSAPDQPSLPPFAFQQQDDNRFIAALQPKPGLYRLTVYQNQHASIQAVQTLFVVSPAPPTP